MADDKIQVLKHAGLWNDSEPPAVMALKAELAEQKQTTKQLVENLVAHIGKIVDRNMKTPGNQTSYTL
jgi:hypothetical protein